MKNNPSEQILAVPVHGQRKLSREGYRTRDGHLIEWLAADSRILVVSRPEPKYIAWTSAYRYKEFSVMTNTFPIETSSWRIPNPLRPKKWWVSSAHSYPTAPESVRSAVVWNPLYGISKSFKDLSQRQIPIVFDLLDDWTLHHHFGGISEHVEAGYKHLFERADYVTANSEGTVALARRFGRDDVAFLPNGCDPERFAIDSTARGPVCVGYVGKIGKRLDLGLISAVCNHLTDHKFVFAGPILDKETGRALSKLNNVQMLGDVRYDDVPKLLQSFDLGWVPHNVGEFEVGGDVIKTYEYRAAGLPTITTPLIGTGKRGLTALYIRASAKEHVEEILRLTKSGRAARVPSQMPVELTWKFKAEFVADLISGPDRSDKPTDSVVREL